MITNYRNLDEKKRLEAKQLSDAQLYKKLEEIYKEANKKRWILNEEPSKETIPLFTRPVKPKELLDDEDIRLEIIQKLSPHMLNNSNIIQFTESLQDNNELNQFNEAFGLFSKQLSGVQRLRSENIDLLWRVFKNKYMKKIEKANLQSLQQFDKSNGNRNPLDEPSILENFDEPEENFDIPILPSIEEPEDKQQLSDIILFKNLGDTAGDLRKLLFKIIKNSEIKGPVGNNKKTAEELRTILMDKGFVGYNKNTFKAVNEKDLKKQQRGSGISYIPKGGSARNFTSNKDYLKGIVRAGNNNKSILQKLYLG